MKNTKLIGLVALLVVVVLVVSVVIATSADNALVEGVNKQFATYQDKIDALQSTIDKLNQGIIDANQALDELKQAGVQIDSWNEATPKIPEKLAAAEKVLKDFTASLSTDDHDWTAHFTSEEVDEDGIFANLWSNVELNIERATSVAAMDEFIAGFKADLEAVETKLEKLYRVLGEIEKDNVTLDDFDNILVVFDLFSDGSDKIADSLYAPAAAEGEKSEKETLSERIGVIYTTFKPLAVGAFVDASKKLPVASLYAPSNFEAYETAVSAYKFAVGLYEEDEAIHSGDCTADVPCDFCVEQAHIVTLYGTDGTDGRHAAVVAIKTAADAVNAAIEAKKDFTIEANKATRTMINDLWALVNEWVADYSIVTNVELETYNAELNALVNRAGIEAYNTALLAKIPALKAAADAYIAEVAKIGDVTHKSADIIAAAGKAYDAFVLSAGLMSPTDADFILGNTEENGVVAAWGVYTDAIADLADINTKIDNVHTAIESLMKVVCNVEHAEGVDCDCKVNTFDDTKLANLPAAMDALKALLTYKGLDETAVKAELLAVLKEAFTTKVLNDVKARVDAAYTAGNKDDDMKDRLYAQIDAFKGTEITFELEIKCQGGHAEGTTCDCTTLGWKTTALETAVKEYAEADYSTFFPKANLE